MTRINHLMQSDRPWMAGFGTETAMIFHEGFDLPHFAAFTLYQSDAGRAALARAAERALTVAHQAQTGFVMDAETWRANLPWGSVMNMDEDAIAAANMQAVTFSREWRDRHETDGSPIAVNGVIGPMGDGYDAATAPQKDDATVAHSVQARALAAAGVDLASAITMTSSAEGAGVARAMKDADLPHVISFTVETDGKLPSGETLEAAIDAVESEGTEPLFYGINCAHPSHFEHVLNFPHSSRIGMVRANASRLSHAELDAMETLDDGDPLEWGALSAGLVAAMPWLRLIGGCCGTDHRHLSCAASCLGNGPEKAA